MEYNKDTLKVGTKVLLAANGNLTIYDWGQQPSHDSIWIKGIVEAVYDTYFQCHLAINWGHGEQGFYWNCQYHEIGTLTTILEDCSICRRGR